MIPAINGLDADVPETAVKFPARPTTKLWPRALRSGYPLPALLKPFIGFLKDM